MFLQICGLLQNGLEIDAQDLWFLWHIFLSFVRSRNGHSPECIMGRNGGTQKIIQGTEGSLAKSHYGANSAYQNGEGKQDLTRYTAGFRPLVFCL